MLVALALLLRTHGHGQGRTTARGRSPVVSLESDTPAPPSVAACLEASFVPAVMGVAHGDVTELISHLHEQWLATVAFAAFMMRDVAVEPVLETPCQRRPPPICDIFSAVGSSG